MANILTRFTQKIFGSSNQNELGQFGSGIDNTRVTSADVETLQALSAYLGGWSDAVITSKNYPTFQEMNGLFYGLSYQIAYMFQNGIPEYDDGTEYKQTSIVKKSGTYQLYGSKTDENIGNPLTDTDNWRFLCDLSAIGQSSGSTNAIGDPIITLSNTLAVNEIWLVGQTVSRVTYADLFNVYGTTYGAGDGSTTFSLPDFRDRVIWGVDTSTSLGYISAGLPNHSHTRGSMNITGNFSGVGQAFYSTPSPATLGGAFYRLNTTNNPAQGARVTNDSSSQRDDWFGFDASRSWTGSTSMASASNAIYGASNTVQPPAIKARVKTRYI